MDNKIVVPSQKKNAGKARSGNNGLQTKNKNGPPRAKVLNNGAVRSLEITLDKLKRANVATGEYSKDTKTKSPVRKNSFAADMLVNSLPPSSFSCCADNVSQVSMDLSRYELLRNLSCCNCNSDEGCSGNTCNKHPSPTELTVKDEHLERYFRSVEMWSGRGICGDQSTIMPKLSER